MVTKCKCCGAKLRIVCIAGASVPSAAGVNTGKGSGRHMNKYQREKRKRMKQLAALGLLDARQQHKLIRTCKGDLKTVDSIIASVNRDRAQRMLDIWKEGLDKITVALRRFLEKYRG